MCDPIVFLSQSTPHTNLRGKLFEFTYKQQVNMQHAKAKDLLLS